MKFSETIIRDNKQNITWINNLRLIAMFAVIVLHTASPLLFLYNSAPVSNWIVADIYNAIVRFAVPVFVMITGALLLHREYELSDFLKKRIGRLILPFLFWSLVYIGYQWYIEIIVFNNDTWANVKLILHQLKTGASYHLWYVYLLIGLYLFIPILSRFIRNATEKEILYFLAIWFLTILISKPYLTQLDTAVDLRYFTGYMGYLVLGYYLAHKRFTIPYLAFPALLIFTACVVLITCGTYYLKIKDHELSTFFYEPVGPFVVMLSASVFLAAKNIKVKIKPIINKIFLNAGKYTLGIYLSHALVLNILELNDITYAQFNPIASIPLVALLCFIISWLAIYALGKVPVLKSFIG